MPLRRAHETRTPKPPPTERRRASRRPLLARSQREAYGREVGLDPARDQHVHERLVDSWARNLEHRRRLWADRSASERALATLRAVLPGAISGRVREQTSNMLAQLTRWLEDVRRPDSMRTVEDWWMADAQHELDDDELAQVLSPAGYHRDREAALRAVRERRRKIARRH